MKLGLKLAWIIHADVNTIDSSRLTREADTGKISVYEAWISDFPSLLSFGVEKAFRIFSICGHSKEAIYASYIDILPVVSASRVSRELSMIIDIDVYGVALVC